jgi:hypothetical protein
VRFNPFAAHTSNIVECRKSLLCNRLVVPTVPHFFGESTFLLSKWRQGGEALARQQVSLAGQIFLSDDGPNRASDSESADFLFNAAHQLLSINAETVADRCIQKGLSLLTSRSEGASSSFNGSLWLVMASSALKRDDLESCRVWLRHGRRCILTSSEGTEQIAPELMRCHGDWCSIEACFYAGTGDLELAGSLLSRACQYHLRGEALIPAAKDLILRSRLRMLEHDWNAADCDLRVAQTLIAGAHSGTDDHCGNKLLRIIAIDLKSVRAMLERLEAVSWN